MLTCYYCEIRFTFLRELITHLRLPCEKIPHISVGIRCGQSGCYRVFDCSNALRKHIERCHAVDPIDPFVTINEVDQQQPLCERNPVFEVPTPTTS